MLAAATRYQLGVAAVVGASCLLLLLSADRVARGVAAILRPVEAMYGEAIIYGQAARFLHGEALYPLLDGPPFTVAAYTPLYYTLAAGLRGLAGPGFGPGRTLSFGAGLLAAIVVGNLAAQKTSRAAGLFAALLFIGLGFPGDYPWFAFYKEDMLGVALSLVALAVLEHAAGRRRSTIAAGALAGLAFLTKQTFVAATVAGCLWLLWQSRARALTFATTTVVVAGVPCLLLAVFDHGFLANTVHANLNPSRADILLANLEILVQYQGLALAITVLPVAGHVVAWQRWLRDPIGLFWLVSLLLLPVELAKVGSNWNYWIELAAATAVLATRGVWQLVVVADAPPFGRLAASAALFGLVLSPIWLPRPAEDLGTVLDHTLRPDQRQATEFAAVLQRVRSEPRGVLAEPLDIVTLADRDVLLEPYIFSILQREGQWDAGSVVQQVCSGQIGLLVLDHPLEGPDWQYHGYPHWPAQVLEALRSTMRLERMQARLFLYVPAAAPGVAASGETPPRACRGLI
jgi:hypothetical protein